MTVCFFCGEGFDDNDVVVLLSGPAAASVPPATAFASARIGVGGDFVYAFRYFV